MIWFRTYESAPKDNPERVAGIPLAWTWETTEQEKPPEGDGWRLVKTAEAYAAYQDEHRDEHDTWRDSVTPPPETNTITMRFNLARLLSERLVKDALDEDTADIDKAIKELKVAIRG